MAELKINEEFEALIKEAENPKENESCLGCVYGRKDGFCLSPGSCIMDPELDIESY